VTDVARQREWLALLEAELGRRTARTEWEAAEGDRAREAFAAQLQEIARRLAVMVDKYPLDVSDMSRVEMLACHLLPKNLQPPGLPSEAAIWAQFRARTRENNR
jgi:hypothetical protein